MTQLPPEQQRRLLAEEVEQYNKILAVESWTVEGSNGQPRPHWALAARRAALDAIRKLDRQLDPSTREVDEFEAFLSEN